MSIEITAAVMLERGARIIADRDGKPVIATAAGRNDEHFRKAVRAWIETPAQGHARGRVGVHRGPHAGAERDRPAAYIPDLGPGEVLKGPYRALARAAAVAGPASPLRRALACLGGLRGRLAGRRHRQTLLGLAKWQPGAFAGLMHGDPGDGQPEPRVVMSPALTALDARRCLRSLGANERATIGHRLPDCWTCRKLLADEDPCGFPHGSVDEIVMTRLGGLVAEGAKR